MHLLCGSVRLALDASDGDVSFLSHAHSDHAGGIGRRQKVIASEETLALAELNPSQLTAPDTVSGKLLDAGHMLGSRQIAVEADGRRTVYTGDISLRENIFGHKAEIPQCDRLIMEATYGSDPAYRFPPHEEVYSQLASFVRSNDSANIVLGCYEMGKTQEAVKIINERCGLAPVVTERAGEICGIYRSFGIKLDYLVIGSDEAEEAMKRPFVALVPMRHAKRYFARKLGEAFERRTLCAALTGWALTRSFDTDAAFPLSDHADFFELREFIAQSGAKEVEFFCGDGRLLLDSQ